MEDCPEMVGLGDVADRRLGGYSGGMRQAVGIAPALHVARHAAFVDLDGPWWLQQDMPGGVHFQQGHLLPPSAGFWGGDA